MSSWLKERFMGLDVAGGSDFWALSVKTADQDQFHLVGWVFSPPEPLSQRRLYELSTESRRAGSSATDEEIKSMAYELFELRRSRADSEGRDQRQEAHERLPCD